MIRTLWTSKSNVNGAVSTATFIAHKGEIWYDNDVAQLRYSDGVTPGGIPILGSGGGGGTGNGSVIQNDFPPANANTTTLWYDTIGGRSYVYFNNAWVDANPQTASYTLPVATTSTLGGVKVGRNLTIDPDGTLNAISSGTGSVSDTFNTIKVTGQTDLVASGLDTLQFTAGAGVIITTNNSPTKSITITNDMFNATLDGGYPTSIYGGLAVVDGGGI